MKKLGFLILAGLFFMGCGGAGSVPTTSSADTKPKVGDTVVAKWASGSFYEGKVDKVDNPKITVAWLDQSNPSLVDSTDVYAMPLAGAKPDVKVGDIVLAKTSAGTMWNGAEITGIDGDVYKVKVVSGTTSVNVQAEKIIKIPSATVADFKEKAGATDFLKEAQKGKLTIPSNYKPRKGDKVVAEWTPNTWYSGRIDNISGSNIYVAWDDNSKPSAVNSSRVMPMPTANNKEMPKENQFLLIKPESGSKWDYAQVTSVNGNSADVKFPDGKTRAITAGEYVGLN